MIGLIVHKFTNSTFGRYLMIGLALLAGVKGYGLAKNREGRANERARQSVQKLKQLRRMHDAGARVATDRPAILDRMRSGSF